MRQQAYFGAYRMFFLFFIFFSGFTTNLQAVITAPLNGSYTVNADGSGDFISLKEAADTYNTYGLNGNSTLIIKSNLVETAMVEFKGTAPNSSTYYLTITTDNTVQRKVSGSINGTLVKLTGADNIIIDGIIPASESAPAASLLSFMNTYSTPAAGVRTLSVEKDGSANSGKYVRVQNVELTLANPQRAPGGGTVAYFSTDSLWINNSYIHNGYNGIYGDANKFIQIQNNIISENHASGIYTLPFATTVDITITRNIIKDMTPISGNRQTLDGIYIEHNAGGGTCDVSNNKIDNLNNQTGSECSTRVLYVYSAAAIKVNGNKISNVYNNSVSVGYALQGIYIQANTTNTTNTIQCLNDTVVNLNSESYAVAISTIGNNSESSLTKNCVVSNISGKGLRPNMYNSIGIYASGAISLEANRVDNVKNTANNALASAIGIYLYKLSSSTGVVSNNMVSDVAGRIGIGIGAVGTVNLYHNSVRLLNKFNDSDEATLIDLGDRLSTANSSNIRIQNNLLSHEVANGLSRNFVLKRQSAPGTSTIITNIANSNNRYYVANSNIAMIVSDRTTQTGAIYPTLSVWTTASTDNSLMVFLPAFTAIDNLHLTAFPYRLQVPLIAGITTDLDGDLRASCGNMAGADINPLGQGPLNGTYRIGNAPADDFSSLKQAADVYNSCGLAGNTTFMIVDDLTEAVTSEFKGSAPNSTLYSLLITTDNTVRRNVTGAINGALVKFSGANNITINGIVPATEGNPNASLLSFTNTYTTGSGAVRSLEIGLEAASHGRGVHILNSEFAMLQNGTFGGVVLNSVVNNLDVEGCFINTGHAGINSSSGNNIRIVNNIVFSTYLYGINVTPLNPATLAVTGNIVTHMIATNPNVRMVGIRLYNSTSTGVWTILNNKVQDFENQNAMNTTIDGIYIDASADVQLNGNIVKNLANSSTNFFFGVSGIYVVTRNAGKLLIANDTISTLRSSSYATGMYITHTNTAAYALIKNCGISDVRATGARVDSYDAMGIVLSNAVNMDAVSITNIKNPIGSASGIYLEGKSGGYVSNCMVSDVAGVVGMGLYVGSGNPGNFYHNTIRLTSKLDDNHESTVVNLGSRIINTGSTAFLQLWNNILSNEVPTGASKNFILKQQPNGAMQQADRSNNRYNITNGNVAIVVSDQTTQTGSVYALLPDWVAVSGDNSVMANPLFVSASDLHLTGSSLTDNVLMVPYLTEVPADFDGNSRDYCNNTAGVDNTDMEFSVTDATLVNATSPGGNITITANEFGGTAPYKYSLNGGTNYYDVTSVANNVITIVTASPVDGTYYLTIKDYNNCVVTAPEPLVVRNPDTKLNDLQVDGVTIEGFNPDKISYVITFSCEKEQVSLLGIANDPEATVSGNGTFSLEPGDNYFAITVTAKDLVTTKTYTVNIIRDCYVPRIIKDLEDAIVCVGGSHTWSVEVEGQNLTYEWYCGFNRIIGANTNSITISDAKLTDYERYYVVIRSNYNGFKASKFSKRVKLWVADYLPAHLKLSDYPNPATAGKTYHVQVDGYPDVTKYVWSYSQEGVTFSPEIGKETENETWATFGTLAVGTGTLKVSMDHPCGTREVTQSITVQHSTGVEDVDLNVVKIFPNPTSGVLKVLNTEANQMIRISDVAGSLKAAYPSQEGTTTIDLTGYAKGTYMVQYNGKAYKVIKK